MTNISTWFRPLALLATASLFCTSCSDTKMQKAWVAPTVGSIQFTKIFVLALTPDDMNRRMAEVAVKNQITKIPAVSSYEFLPDVADIMKKDKVIPAIKESQADGIIVLRLLSHDTSLTFSAASPLSMGYEYYYSDSSNTNTAVPFYQNSASLYSNRMFGIETTIYDVKTRKLIWKGETLTTKSATNVGDVPTLIAEVAETVRATLKSQGLIK